jgi:hypothetical protein
MFLVVVAVLGAMLPGYDPTRHFVSLASLGPLGGIQVANFVLTGVFVFGFGFGLARDRAASPAATRTGRTIVGVGIGLVIAGLFAGDPALGYPPGAPAGLPTTTSWHANIHYLGAVLVFVGLPIATSLDARAASREGRMAWAVYALISGAIVLAAWLAGFAVTNEPAGSLIGPGLTQRIAVAAGFQWLIATAIRKLARTPDVAAARAEPARLAS